jgi:hypothetical protein
MQRSFSRNMIRGWVVVLVSSALAACTAVSPQTAVPPAPPQPTQSPLTCNQDYTRHELPAALQWDQNPPMQVYTSRPDEFHAALQELGISAACVPEEVGAPYLRLHSNNFNSAAVQGVMAIYRFDA